MRLVEISPVECPSHQRPQNHCNRPLGFYLTLTPSPEGLGHPVERGSPTWKFSIGRGGPWTNSLKCTCPPCPSHLCPPPLLESSLLGVTVGGGLRSNVQARASSDVFKTPPPWGAKMTSSGMFKPRSMRLSTLPPPAAPPTVTLLSPRLGGWRVLPPTLTGVLTQSLTPSIQCSRKQSVLLFVVKQ